MAKRKIPKERMRTSGKDVFADVDVMPQSKILKPRRTKTLKGKRKVIGF